jgi:MoxR-like ATPase
VSPEEARLRAVESQPPGAHDAHADLENALFEVKRVIVGQEAMLERVIVALLTGATCCSKACRPGQDPHRQAVSDALGGTFKRLQFTPDLVPADLVGTRVFRPDTGGFDTSSAPCSATSCWPTRSTARPRRSSRRCWRSCRSIR